MLRGIVVLAAVLAAGNASAQLAPSLELSLEGLPASVLPVVENPAFSAVVTASCDAVLAHVDPTDPSAGTPVHVEVHATNGVVVTGAPTAIFDPQECVGADHATVHIPLQISIPRTAPGLVPLPVTGTARLPASNPSQGLVSAPATATVIADYYSVSQAKVSSKLHSCDAPCRVDIPIEVTNFGNARTQYTFQLASEPSGSGWTAALPDVLLIDSPNSGQGAPVATVVLQIGVPRAAGEGSYQIVVTPSAADDPGKVGNPLTVNVLVRDTSVLGKATPLPGVVPLVLALAGLAVAFRRRA